MNGKNIGKEYRFMTKTIKEIYNEEFVSNPETSLLKHYNSILNKTPDELDVNDICVLIRQEFFLDIAVPKAIELIKENHAVGDNYDYCLLVNLSTMENPLSEYKTELSILMTMLENDLSKIEFELDSDKTDYCESVERLKDKINK